MKKLIALVLIFSGIAFAQAEKPETLTARQYYEELRAASGLNPYFTSVCFRPDSPDIFDLLGFTREFEATAKAKGIPLTPKERKQFAAVDGLLIRTYKNGVQTGEDTLEREDDHWRSGFKSKGHTFHLIVAISPAGRYRRAVYVDDSPSATSEGYGKCEPIQ